MVAADACSFDSIEFEETRNLNPALRAGYLRRTVPLPAVMRGQRKLDDTPVHGQAFLSRELAAPSRSARLGLLLRQAE